MKFYYLTLIFFLSLCSDIVKAQNRYDTPAEAPIINTYVPMSHEEMMLRAAAAVWKKRQAIESFADGLFLFAKETNWSFCKLCKCCFKHWALQHTIVLQFRNIILFVRTTTQRKKIFKESF